jgi:hypothetical protein
LRAFAGDDAGRGKLPGVPEAVRQAVGCHVSSNAGAKRGRISSGHPAADGRKMVVVEKDAVKAGIDPAHGVFDGPAERPGIAHQLHVVAPKTVRDCRGCHGAKEGVFLRRRAENAGFRSAFLPFEKRLNIHVCTCFQQC